jgi:hypothetical protein
MADLLCFLIIGVKYLEMESIIPSRFGLLRNFRLCTQGWYLLLYCGNFFRKNSGLKMDCLRLMVGYCFNDTKGEEGVSDLALFSSDIYKFCYTIYNINV